MNSNAHKGLPVVGDPAPDFSAVDSNSRPVQLSSLRGKPVVLIFYPGDNTPVCTAQLCAVRDVFSQGLRGAAVFGVNPASLSRHASFATANQLPFPLIVDSGSRIATAYGCSALFGMLTKRTVFVIGRDGRIAWMRRGNPPVTEIVAAVEQCLAGSP